jgi:hypothetical protein
MTWFLMMHLFSTLMEWIRIGQLSDREKDLEILLLRKQLAIVERKLDKPLRVSRAERLILAILAIKLKSIKGYTVRQLREVVRIFQPETVFRWHRELVRRKWTASRSDEVDGHAQKKQLSASSFVLPVRTMTGGTAKSKAN